MSNWKRTHSCGGLGASDSGKDVVLMGWVKGVRDLGGITFIDLRDRRGLTQIVVRPDARQVSGAAKEVGSEWVIAVRGKVARREQATINPNLPTGEIEVVAEELRVLSESKTPPFLPEDDLNVGEELRLRHRYLDLRRPVLMRNLATRSRLALSARSYLDQQDFCEIETPYLTKSTPEGARDYLVPSRTQKGSFYALPQSPQLFKQILMVAGFDRYFQIARCFRDEDLRADRQPEFTQIDIEMSFVEQDDVFEVVEGLFVHMLGEVGIAVSAPFSRLTWAEAMDRYGSDKPDLRYGLEIADVSKIFSGSGYGVFEKVIEQGGAVRAMVAPACAVYSRKDIDGLEKLAKSQGAAGLGWARWTDSELSSPMSKHVGEARLKDAFDVHASIVVVLRHADSVADEYSRCIDIAGSRESAPYVVITQAWSKNRLVVFVNLESEWAIQYIVFDWKPLQKRILPACRQHPAGLHFLRKHDCRLIVLVTSACPAFEFVAGDHTDKVEHLSPAYRLERLRQIGWNLRVGYTAGKKCEDG